jgi:hypothetical protein
LIISIVVFLRKNALQKCGETVVAHVTAVGHQMLHYFIGHIFGIGEVLL